MYKRKDLVLGSDALALFDAVYTRISTNKSTPERALHAWTGISHRTNVAHTGVSLDF